MNEITREEEKESSSSISISISRAADSMPLSGVTSQLPHTSVASPSPGFALLYARAHAPFSSGLCRMAPHCRRYSPRSAASDVVILV
jgi:hypothetical protein